MPETRSDYSEIGGMIKEFTKAVFPRGNCLNEKEFNDQVLVLIVDHDKELF